MDKKNAFERLRNKIISCQRCPRLIEYISKVSEDKVRRYKDWNYWGKPLPGFGDLDARLLIIGLAPAAHGGNRTGRMFTGDNSGEWLVKALYNAGFTNQHISVRKDDGLRLKSAYITAVARCAPPHNKLLAKEIYNCAEYLLTEITILDRVEVILTLGRIAFNTYIKYACTQRTLSPKPHFQHGGFFKLKESTILAASYHPSRQNTQTGRLSWEMWMRIFDKIKNILN